MPVRYRVLEILALFVVLASGVHAQTDNEPRRLAMWEEPSHQPVFHRDHIRVMDVFFPGGATSEFHFHENAATYVFVQSGRVADQTYGESWVKFPVGAIQPGMILMRTNYIGANLFHRVRNIDTKPTQIFAVVNLSDKEADPMTAQVEMTDGEINNAWFRVRRLELAAQSTSTEFTPADDAILMQVGDGQSHVLNDGQAGDYKSIGGGFSYHPAGTSIAIVNEGSAAAAFVLIEVKE